MKILITQDKDMLIPQMFQESMQSYNFLKSDILLYLLYGENLKWRYNEDDQTFYIMKEGSYLTELSKAEWKRLFCENVITITAARDEISIKATPEVEKKFLDLLEELHIEYAIKRESPISKILRGATYKLDSAIGYNNEE